MTLRNIALQRNTASKPFVYGIGLTIDVRSDGLLITGVKNGSPAKAAGLLIGDKITAVENIPITARNANERLLAIAGPRNSIVKINLDRKGELLGIVIPRSMAIYEAALLEIDITGSVGGFFNSDFVLVKNNSGRDLNNVTLFIELKGRHGRNGVVASDSHLHYLDRWPAGTTKVARYLSSSATGISQNESVDQIDTLRYELYSNEFFQENSIEYTGTAYDNTLENLCDKLTLYGSWRAFEPDHWLYNSGFLVQNSNLGKAFPATHVTVRPSWGGLVRGFRWETKDGYLPSGTSDALPLSDGRYFSHADFNRGRPDAVEVELEFPYSNYTCKKRWNLRN